jgi:predicted transcriptional regulator of viral defense system
MGTLSDYELALSLKLHSYLSHGTAAYLHGLSDQESDIIYVKKEQSAKNQSGSLSQAGINRAFSSKQRQSAYIVTCNRAKIMLLSGKDSGRLGVSKTIGSKGEHIEFTDLERTLIDIAVRPGYAGGISNVLENYVRASGQTSVERLSKILEKLDYTYPYHQAIGFLLQSAGHPPSALRLFREPRLKFDFFLAHAMKETKYDKQWRIHYPADLRRS